MCLFVRNLLDTSAFGDVEAVAPEIWRRRLRPWQVLSRTMRPSLSRRETRLRKPADAREETTE